MNQKLKVLERVLVVRQRMRDAASAAAQVAEEQRSSAMLTHARAEGAVTSLFDAAEKRLQTASHVDELVRLDAERVLAQHVARDAAKTAQQRAVEAEAKRDVLRSRSRDVHVFEKVIADVRQARTRREAKNEQIAADDLNGWRTV